MKDAVNQICSSVNPVKNECGLQMTTVPQVLHLWVWDMGPWNLLYLVHPWVGDGREFC